MVLNTTRTMKISRTYPSPDFWRPKILHNKKTLSYKSQCFVCRGHNPTYLSVSCVGAQNTAKPENSPKSQNSQIILEYLWKKKKTQNNVEYTPKTEIVPKFVLINQYFVHTTSPRRHMVKQAKSPKLIRNNRIYQKE